MRIILSCCYFIHTTLLYHVGHFEYFVSFTHNYKQNYKQWPPGKCFTSIRTILNLFDLDKALRMSWASDKFGGRVTKNVKFASLRLED